MGSGAAPLGGGEAGGRGGGCMKWTWVTGHRDGRGPGSRGQELPRVGTRTERGWVGPCRCSQEQPPRMGWTRTAGGGAEPTVKSAGACPPAVVNPPGFEDKPRGLLLLSCDTVPCMQARMKPACGPRGPGPCLCGGGGGGLVLMMRAPSPGSERKEASSQSKPLSRGPSPTTSLGPLPSPARRSDLGRKSAKAQA